MENKTYEYLIVGTGAGGATLARELTRRGKTVLVIERGKREQKIGTFWDSLKFFDLNPLTLMPKKSREGIILWRTFMAGGASVVSFSNLKRCMQGVFEKKGLDLHEEFQEAERDLGIITLPEKLMSEGSLKIMEAAQALGYKMVPMTKAIDPDKCQRCGQCILGCVHGAKWSSLNFLREAQNKGADVVFRTQVEKAIVQDGKVIGVEAKHNYRKKRFLSDKVIFCAGALETPRLLQRTGGIEGVGQGLSMDIIVNTCGVTKGINMLNEPLAPTIDEEFYQSKGFLLLSYCTTSKILRFIESGLKGFLKPTKRLIGIMTLINDEANGVVYENGSVSKPLTPQDRKRIQDGTSIAKKILVKAGADEKSIFSSYLSGSHFCGTAAIGRVVGKDLQTKIKGLYVCDASIFPQSPGRCPMLAVVSIAKWLGKRI